MELTSEQIAKIPAERIEEFDNNPEALEKYLAGQDSPSEKDSDEDHEQVEEEGAANGAVETKEDAEEEQDEDEPVVLTKDGKRTIPYSEYKELRVKVAELNEKLRQMPVLEKARDELQALKQQKTQAKTPERRAEIQKQLVERINTLREDFPEVGTSLESVNELFTDLSEELKAEKAANAERERAAKEEQARQDEEKARALNEQVQEAKENNPDLSFWEKNDKPAFDEAVRQDQAMLLDPKWQKKSIDERFIEVARRVRAVMPDASEPPNAEPSAKIKQKAKAQLEKAPVKKPTTLSDIQGGANPLSESEQLNNLSPFELFKRLRTMPDGKAAAMRADLD